MFSSLCNLDRCSVEQLNILDTTIQPYNISAKPFRSVDSKVWHMSSDIDDFLHYVLVVIYLLFLSSDFQLRSFLLRAALNNAVHRMSHKLWQEDQSELMKPGRRWEGAKRDGAKGGGGQRWRWESRVGVAWWEKKKNTAAKGKQRDFFLITSFLSDDPWHDNFFTWWPPRSPCGMILICTRPTVTPVCNCFTKMCT